MLSNLKRRLLAALAIATAGAALPAAAHATTLVGLTGERTLVVIDHDKRKLVRTVEAQVPGRILGIDVRPKDGKLYALTSANTVVTVDPKTGRTGKPVTLATPLPKTERFSIDFNPALDRLRVVGADNSNLNVDVDAGTVLAQTPIAYAANNPLGGTTPAVNGVAYSNNFAGTRTTLLYDIDAATRALYLQLPPPAGVLTPVGPTVSLKSFDAVGFDILTDRRSRNWGIVAADGKIVMVDLAGGAAFSAYEIRAIRKTPLRDLAALPISGRFEGN